MLIDRNTRIDRPDCKYEFKDQSASLTGIFETKLGGYAIVMLTFRFDSSSATIRGFRVPETQMDH